MNNLNQTQAYIEAWGILPFIIIIIAILLLLIFIAILGLISNTYAINKKLSSIDDYLNDMKKEE